MQERSRRRRDALLRAAIEVLAEGGAKAVTHRAVAARAGLPPASTTYYFTSIQELTEEALRLHTAERVEALQAITREAAGTGSTVEDIARRFALALTGRSRESVIAQYEVYLEAARTPALRKTVADALAGFEELAESVLTVLGARRPREGAEAFVALLDGFALHRLARPRSVAEDAEALFEAMRATFIAYAMTDKELARWQDKLSRALAAT